MSIYPGKIGELDELSQLHSIENEKLKFEIKKLNDKMVEKEEELTRLKDKHNKAIGIWEEKYNQLKKVNSDLHFLYNLPFAKVFWLQESFLT